MSDTFDARNPSWQALQRRLAASVDLQFTGYPAAPARLQPHWRYGAAAHSWLGRARSGVHRSQHGRASVASR